MTNKVFLRLGDHPLLDLCNTQLNHSDGPEDRLLEPEDAERFCKEVFNIKCKLTRADFKDLLELRQHLRRYFAFLLGLEKVDPSAELNAWLAHYPLNLQVSKSITAELASVKDQRLYAQLIVTLYDFLRQLDPTRLKKCANPNCSHLFYDVSKNNKRQWCSMQSCGNIMKARAFYARKKQNAP